MLLVGRTGLDAALRLDPLFEVHRAENGLTAIGQLSLLEARQSNVPVVVVLGPGTDPTLHGEEFAGALGLISPNTRVVHVAIPTRAAVTGDSAAATAVVQPMQCPAGCVGAIDATAEPSAIRAAIRAMARRCENAANIGSASVEASLVHRKSPTETGDAANVTTPLPLPLPSPLDTPLVQALLTGRDPILPALDAIRAVLGTPDVHFVEKIGAVPAAAGVVNDPSGSAPIIHSSHEYGTLVAPAIPSETLRPWADWLAHWLALRDQQEQLRAGALIDDLTGAWNRRYFDRFLQAAIKHAAEHSHYVTVLYFDIDDFKNYNDKYGHAAGDEILRETVRLLLSVIRPTDRVCRIGGDEFGVIFHEPTGPRDPGSKPPTSIWSIAERFQRQICEHRFPKLLDHAAGTLTISAGLASYPIDAQTPEELVCKADQLAIQSKRQGKNAITLGPGAERVCRLSN